MNNIDERTGKPKIILHLCAKTGSDSQRYADMGYDRRIIGEEIGVENYSAPPLYVWNYCKSGVYRIFFGNDNAAARFKERDDISKSLFAGDLGMFI